MFHADPARLLRRSICLPRLVALGLAVTGAMVEAQNQPPPGSAALAKTEGAPLATPATGAYAGPSAMALHMLRAQSPDELARLLTFLGEHGQKLLAMTPEQRQQFLAQELARAQPAGGGQARSAADAGGTYKMMSDAAKEKFRAFMRDSREQFMTLGPDERREFTQQAMDRIAAEDRQAPAATPARK